MLFSVIIPVYNSEKFIRRCINSILEQTYQEFEVIVIDDGSTDSTSKILENFSEKDARIKVYAKRCQKVPKGTGNFGTY